MVKKPVTSTKGKSTSTSKKGTTLKQVEELAKKATSAKKSSNPKTAKIAKTIQTKATEKLEIIQKKKPKTKKQKLLKNVVSIFLFLAIVVSGYFTYEEIAPFSPTNPYDAKPLLEYYNGAEGLEGEELRVFLVTLLETDFVGVNYGMARTALADADVDPSDDTKVLTIYSRDSVARVWDGKTWHREHVWPNSRLGVPRVTNTQINQASDLHNLRAIVPSINSSRSNKVFDSITTQNTYFPGDDDKGDVARILFYMVIRYPFMRLSDDILPNDSSTNYKLEGAVMSRFSMLLQWHYEDPVDDFERNRNEVIYSYQNNRNPFIDHPELVTLLFEHEDYSLRYNSVALDIITISYIVTTKKTSIFGCSIYV